jgi:hypothetical protein
MFEDLTYCSIRDFKKLQFVELDHLTIVPYQKEILNDAGIDEPLSQGFYAQPEQVEESEPSKCDLAEALPASIQHLQINRFPGHDGLPSLRYLLDKKEAGWFPDLTEIIVDTYFFEPPEAVEWGNLQKAFERVGLDLRDSTESGLANGGDRKVEDQGHEGQDMDLESDELKFLEVSNGTVGQVLKHLCLLSALCAIDSCLVCGQKTLDNLLSRLQVDSITSSLGWKDRRQQSCRLSKEITRKS